MEHNKSINRQSELRLSQEALLKLQENCRHIQKILLKITIETSELLWISFGDTLETSCNILQKMQFSFKLHRVPQKPASVIVFY